MNFYGKRLLIVGGAFQHVKLVEAAHKMGVITYVIDNLPVDKSPAKKISDFYFDCDIFDYDKIVTYCKENKIDGAVAAYLDACQLPYQRICELMGYFCFGNFQQFKKLTDKTSFVKSCIENNIDIIPQYCEEKSKLIDKNDFPLFVKPCDSRGSRGQSVVFKKDDLDKAIKFAKKGKQIRQDYY